MEITRKKKKRKKIVIRKLKQFIPTQETLLSNKNLSFFHQFFKDPDLWHFNCHSVATATSIGLFIGYLPLPGHMFLASLCAILLRANLPLAVAWVWISNPFTIPFMFYIAYLVGSYVLKIPLETFHFQMNYHWFAHEVAYFGRPILVGAVICGTILSLIGNIVVRIYYKR